MAAASREERLAVLPGVRRHALQRLLPEEVRLVAHARHVGHVDAGERHRAPLVDGPERPRDQLAGGGEHDGRVHRDGELGIGGARPLGAQLEGEPPVGRIARHDVDRASPVARDLERDVGDEPNP